VSAFLHDWAEGGVAEMISDFGITADDLAGAEILVASYTYEDYSGAAFVLFRRDGKLYEVNGSHCSCYGLSENSYSGSTATQWQPEETTAKSLAHRTAHDRDFPSDVADKIREVLS
jgi:hypothetical protein